jgi:tRNA threonylcarbamoyladenosine biosynthesis protein TsaB
MYLNFIVLDLSLSHLVILLAHNNKIVYKNKITLKRDRAGILFNSIQSLIRELNLNLSDLDILFSTIGPGNFNGIRVSLSFVKGFAITNNTQIAGLSSLEAISRSFFNNNKKNIFSIIKASPNFYYIEFFNQFNKSLVPPRLINIDEEIALPVSINDIVLVGNDVEILAKNINFHGEMYSIESPTPESLFYTAKDAIVSSHFIEPNPIYLREVNAQKPSTWKKNPIVK